MKTRPRAGQRVSFLTRHSNPGYGVPEGMNSEEKFIETRYQKVKILPAYSWLTPYEFVVEGGHVIHLRNVVGFKGRVQEQSRVQVSIRGSKGDLYTVTVVDGEPISCTCPGFRFRSRCRHLEEVIR